MILPDVNLLLYAYDSKSRAHATAKDWWQETLSGTARVGLAWQTILAFLRIGTNPAIYDVPMTSRNAIQTVRTWLAHPAIEILQPGEGHAEILFGFIEAAGIAGNLTSGAHLAAIAIEHRADLASTDRDFARFPGLKWFNPLDAKRTTRPRRNS